MLGLAGVAKPMIYVVLTPKWLEAVPYMQIYCLSMAFLPIQTGCLQGINAVGRSDLFLKIALVKTLTSLAALIGALLLFENPLAIAGVTLVTMAVACAINAQTCRWIIGYGYGEQLADTVPALAASGIMLAAVQLAGGLALPYWQMLILQVAVGAVVYGVACVLFRIPAFFRMLELAKGFLRK